MNSVPSVLHNTLSWLPQTQTWIQSQIVALQELGVDAHVVCEFTTNINQFAVQNLHCFRNEPIWSQMLDSCIRKTRIRRHLRYVEKVAQHTESSIIHSHFGNYAWLNLGAVRNLGAKHVVTFYGQDVNMLPTQFPIWRRRYRQLFNEADLILCEGSHMAECIMNLGCSRQKVKVQHLGINLERIEFKPRFWQPSEPLKVLIAASFREKKGIPYAIEALAMLNKDLPIELTIIGDAAPNLKEQQEKANILNTVSHANFFGNVRFLGYQSHQTLFHEAYKHHIFLSPSITALDGDTEGGAPVTLIEMAASGMPIVSTKHCDIPEIIHHGLTGLLAEERDVEGLAEQIKWLIENPKKWLQILTNARQHIEREYDLHQQGVKLLDWYKLITT